MTVAPQISCQKLARIFLDFRFAYSSQNLEICASISAHNNIESSSKFVIACLKFCVAILLENHVASLLETRIASTLLSLGFKALSHYFNFSYSPWSFLVSSLLLMLSLKCEVKNEFPFSSFVSLENIESLSQSMKWIR